MFAAVSKINNPKSKNDGKWTVLVSSGSSMEPMKTVFVSEKKKECVEYAKRICERPYVSNGIEYGCKF